MLSINKITMRNFFSFGNASQTVELDSNQITLILGQNNDANTVNDDITGRRNGVGKSAIVQALVFGLFGKSIGNEIKIPNLVNKINSKNCVVTIEFTKDGLDYKIERGRSPTFFNFIKYDMKNVVNDESRGEKKDTQEELNEILNISQLLFEHLVVLNANVEPFLALGAQKQRDMIEELLGITQLTEKANLLKDLYKESKRLADQEKFKIETLTESNKRIIQSIESLQLKANDFESRKNKSITELENNLKEFSNLNFDELLLLAETNEYAIKNNIERSNLEKRVSNLRLKKEEYEISINYKKEQLATKLNELQKIDIIEELSQHENLETWYTLEQLLKEYKNDKELKEQKLKSLNDKISIQNEIIISEKNKLDDILDSKCPLCKNSLSHDESHTNIKNSVEESIITNTKLLDNYNIEKNKIIEELNEIELFDMPIKPVTFYSTLTEAKLHEHKLVEMKKQYDEKVINIYDEEFMLAYNELNDMKIMEVIDLYSVDEVKELQYTYNSYINDLEREKSSQNPYFEQIETLKSNSLQIVDYDEFNKLEKLADHQDYLYKLLMNKDSFVRRRIIEQNISFLNTRLQYWIEKSGSEHTVIFMNDLSVDINLNGQSYDFKQLSRGERTRINISLSLAFRDTYEALNQSINIIFVDEMIDVGLDPAGVLQLWNIFNDIGTLMNKNVYVISHKEELIQKAENILKIVKEDSFSTIEYASIDDIY